MSKVQVDTIDTRSGTSTMQIGSTNTSTINIGVSGDTVNIPSGVTIANAGTATGFGGNNTPAFEVCLSGNQDFSDSTITKVTFNSETYDVGNCFDTSNYKWTPTTAGKYFVYCQLQCFTASGGYSNLRYAESQIRKNNSQVRAAYVDLQLNEERQQNINCTAIIDMNGSSDYLDFWCEINTVDNGDARLISNASSSRAGGFLLIGA